MNNIIVNNNQNINIYDILDAIEEMIERATAFPLSKGKVLVNADHMVDLLSSAKINLPSEIKKSMHICKECDMMYADAKKDAENIIKAAENKAKRILNEQEILKQAQSKANEMLIQANKSKLEVKKTTSEYVDKTLATTEEALIKALTKIRESRQEARKVSKK